MVKEYLIPKSIEKVLSFFQEYGEEAQVLAGATDVFQNKRSLKKVIIDISEAGLDYVSIDGEGLKIGGCTTFFTLIKHLANGPYNMIAEAAQSLGTHQIRNIATIGGNLCTASPAADSPPPLYVLEAKVKLTSSQGSRILPIEEFFIAPHKTALEVNEILEEIQVPLIVDENRFTCFDKVRRVKGKDLAIVNCAVALTFQSEKKCKQVRICLGAVALTPLRVKAAEDLIQGKRLSDEIIERAAQKAADETKPISDIRGSAEYRKLRSQILVKRALLKAAASISS